MFTRSHLERIFVSLNHCTPSTRLAWVKRAVMSGAVGVVSGFIAHAVMGGADPGLAGVIPAMVASTLVSLAVLYRPGASRTLVATLVSQWLFHNLAGLGAGSASSGHVHGAVEPLIAAAGAEFAMSLGHVVAAIVTAGFVLGTFRLRHYARAVASIVASLVTLRAVSTPVVVASELRLVTHTWRYRFSNSQRAWSARLLRGPPLLLSH